MEEITLNELSLEREILGYIDSFYDIQRERLLEIHNIIKSVVPFAKEKISYGMPAFYDKTMLVYYSACKNHIGLYPTGMGIEAVKEKLVDYKYSKGAIQFPYNKQLPTDLIKEIVKIRVLQTMEYQIHITFKDFDKNEIKKFKQQCKIQKVKCLLIELESGEFIKQPMITKKTCCDDLNKVLLETEEIINKFIEQGFIFVRTKIEVDMKYLDVVEELLSHNSLYYEWHGKFDVKYCDMVSEICKDNVYHISTNSIDGTKFITIRQKDKLILNDYVNKLTNKLEEKNIVLIKSKYEACIYDSNINLDRGW